MLIIKQHSFVHATRAKRFLSVRESLLQGERAHFATGCIIWNLVKLSS